MKGPILYPTEDGHSHIRLRARGQTTWLTRLEMAKLFAAQKNISRYPKSLFGDGKAVESSVVNQYLTAAADSKRHQVRNDSVGLRHEATVKEFLTVQTGGSSRATTENFSVDQTLGTGQVLRCAKSWNQVLLRQRLHSSVSN